MNRIYRCVYERGNCCGFKNVSSVSYFDYTVFECDSIL